MFWFQCLQTRKCKHGQNIVVALYKDKTQNESITWDAAVLCVFTLDNLRLFFVKIKWTCFKMFVYITHECCKDLDELSQMRSHSRYFTARSQNIWLWLKCQVAVLWRLYSCAYTFKDVQKSYELPWICLFGCCYNWASTRENMFSEVCEQHRRRPACASAQSDQRLCYSYFRKCYM